ncbi:MAG TPA: alpha/beta hydrolase [Marmoricola sp.]|nr:alpha/beta hydrolase [Marmoricola sp.]
MTGGAGLPLLLVHGGMCTSQRWGPLWSHLVEVHEVTVMDRRGRASSTDGDEYSLRAEIEDVTAVVEQLVERHASSVDVFGHSFGALCALGAAGGGSAVRRLALFEPPGPTTLPRDWLPRVRSMVERGELGRAMFSFLVEVVGLTAEEVERLRDSADGPDPLPIVARTLVREAVVIRDLDVVSLCCGVTQPALLLTGSASPPWAAEITRTVAAHLPHSMVVEVPDHGHEGVDTAAEAVAHQVAAFMRVEDGRG